MNAWERAEDNGSGARRRGGAFSSLSSEEEREYGRRGNWHGGEMRRLIERVSW